MQVDAGGKADHAIKDTRGKGFRDRIKAGKLPTRHQVVPFLEFCQVVRNLFGVILQVTIHGKDDLAPAAAESGYQRGRFAKVAAETDHAYNIPVFVVQFLEFLKGFVGAAIIHKNYFM